MSNSIWQTLSAIDCNKHVEKKGKFSYLSWTWAWSMVKENYSHSVYSILDDTVYPDGTMEVRVEVTIENLSHIMWLPVLDFKNNAIPNPNAFDVNSARMRCLVKCLAMFGLGHYIYAGESTPQEPPLPSETPQMVKAGAEINRYLEDENYPDAAAVYDEWSHEELQVICRAPSNGGQLTTQNRERLKSTNFRLALNAVRGIE